MTEAINMPELPSFLRRDQKLVVDRASFLIARVTSGDYPKLHKKSEVAPLPGDLKSLKAFLTQEEERYKHAQICDNYYSSSGRMRQQQAVIGEIEHLIKEFNQYTQTEHIEKGTAQ